MQGVIVLNKLRVGVGGRLLCLHVGDWSLGGSQQRKIGGSCICLKLGLNIGMTVNRAASHRLLYGYILVKHLADHQLLILQILLNKPSVLLYLFLEYLLLYEPLIQTVEFADGVLYLVL